MKKKRLALLGCGYLNQIVAYAYVNNYLPEYELVGAYGRSHERTQAFGKHFGCKPCESIEELLELKPDIIGEAASPQAMIDYGELILKSGSDIVVLSTGVFKDAAFYKKIKNIAMEANQKVYIASGAVGGFDIFRAACLMSPVKATMTSKKRPGSLYYTPLNREGLLQITEPERVYQGNAKEATEMMPYFFNVAIAASLASVGPEKLNFNIDAIPNFRGDDYKILIQGREVVADVDIYSSNYGIAGWSVVATLQNIVSPIVF